MNWSLFGQFTCSLCLKRFEDPVVASCNHIFCRNCLNGPEILVCLLDRTEINKSNIIDLAIYDPIFYKQVFDPNTLITCSQGCACWTGCKKDEKLHIDTDCLNTNVVCPFACQHLLQRNKMQEHFYQKHNNHNCLNFDQLQTVSNFVNITDELQNLIIKSISLYFLQIHAKDAFKLF